MQFLVERNSNLPCSVCPRAKTTTNTPKWLLFLICVHIPTHSPTPAGCRCHSCLGPLCCYSGPCAVPGGCRAGTQMVQPHPGVESHFHTPSGEFLEARHNCSQRVFLSRKWRGGLGRSPVHSVVCMVGTDEAVNEYHLHAHPRPQGQCLNLLSVCSPVLRV